MQPSEDEIVRCLEQVTRKALANNEEITVNSARALAVKELGLDQDFFKDGAWRSRSKAVISAAAQDPNSPQVSKSRKRESKEAFGEKKRPKKTRTPTSSTPRNQIDSDNDQGSEVGKHDGDTESFGRGINGGAGAMKFDNPEEEQAAVGDESDMSSLIDEPPRKKRQSRSEDPKPKGKKAAKKNKDMSSDEEEIKRLQGWLSKCGMKRVWGKELKKYDTNKEKIRHLKALLHDVGMTGRYSLDKAKQIKVARELAIDLEDTKEFNAKWGQAVEDESGNERGASRLKRLPPKGLVDIGDSGDEGSD
ncbi:hypothetical protein K470DRAFT_220257 [Piedraia hortae CBS 480.64]|uniref:Uncharacterized protein n=1 Tax=Piedraia hortae CBS 480.64 TaxID=1314780 RepID=A0A6A7BVY1_9PEZI|nr:hypothetical protein K470DRAFT_220257 [Piedraia hortae CBS 480.64]